MSWTDAIREAEAVLGGEPYRAWGADTLRDAHLQGLADHRAWEVELVRCIGVQARYGREWTGGPGCTIETHRQRTAHLLRLLNIEVPGEQPTGEKDGQ